MTTVWTHQESHLFNLVTFLSSPTPDYKSEISSFCSQVPILKGVMKHKVIHCSYRRVLCFYGHFSQRSYRRVLCFHGHCSPRGHRTQFLHLIDCAPKLSSFRMQIHKGRAESYQIFGVPPISKETREHKNDGWTLVARISRTNVYLTSLKKYNFATSERQKNGFFFENGEWRN